MTDAFYIIYNLIEKTKTNKETETSFKFNTQVNIYDPVSNDEKMKRGIKSQSTDITMVKPICILKIERKKVSNKAKEHLKISAYIGDNIAIEPNVIFANIIDLKDQLIELVRIGTGLIKDNIKDVVNFIEQEYPRMNVDIDTSSNGMAQLINQGILMYYKEYEEYVNKKSESNDKDKKESYYKIDGNNEHFYVGVNKFKSDYEDSELFSILTIKDFRSMLSAMGYTYCSTNRTDYTETNLGKVIAFKIDKLEEIGKANNS